MSVNDLIARAKKDVEMIDKLEEPTDIESRLALTIVDLVDAFDPNLKRYEAIKKAVSEALPADIPDHVYDAITDPIYDWIMDPEESEEKA